ncbi:MAG: ABC transporter substrate-binding protein [Promethearchaeota archaeon]
MKTIIKKYIALTLLFFTLIPLYSISFVAADTSEESDEVHFVVGAVEGGVISTLDPIMYRMSAESQIITQVCETLFVQEEVGGQILPRLALSREWENVTTLDVTLRQGVTFSDGTSWNAEAAQWNIDRMLNSMTWGSPYAMMLYLPSDGFRTVEGVDLSWLPANEMVPVINHTEVVDDYTLRFSYNVPFDMTTIFIMLGMMSPTAHADFLNLPMFLDNGPGMVNWTFEDGLVGTGAFRFVSFNAQDSETKMWSNKDYWGEVSYITNLTYSYLESPSTLQAALIAEQVDLIRFIDDPSVYDSFDYIIYENLGGKYVSNYVVMFDSMPVYVKEAFNYGWNYDYFLNEVMKGAQVKATGVVFPGVEYYNPEINLPDFNITRARQVLIDGGMVDGAIVENWNETDWQAKADGNEPFAEYGLDYISVFQGQAEETREAGRRLGIKVNLQPVEMALFWGSMMNPNRTDTADMAIMGMGLYGDFQTYAQFCYQTGGPYNVNFLSDAEIDGWISEYLITVNSTERQQLVDNIADKIQNELYCNIWTDGSAVSGAYNRKWDNINLYTMEFGKVTLYVESTEETTISAYSIFSLFGTVFVTLTILVYMKKKHI